MTAYLSPVNLQRATSRVNVSTIQCLLGPVGLFKRFKCITSQGMFTKSFHAMKPISICNTGFCLTDLFFQSPQYPGSLFPDARLYQVLSKLISFWGHILKDVTKTFNMSWFMKPICFSLITILWALHFSSVFTVNPYIQHPSDHTHFISI